MTASLRSMPHPPEGTVPGWQLERQLWDKGVQTVIGVDEAGRGALAGPVTAAAVVLGFLEDLPYRDSKTLKPEERDRLALELRETAVAAATGWASAREVDALGVLAATHVACSRALAALDLQLDQCGLVTDYLFLDHPGPVLAVPRADASSLQAAAASILAKTARDAYMARLSGTEVVYGFDTNRGYGTPAHLEALNRHGPGAHHRLTYAPVASRLCGAAASGYNARISTTEQAPALERDDSETGVAACQQQ